MGVVHKHVRTNLLRWYCTWYIRAESTVPYLVPSFCEHVPLTLSAAAGEKEGKQKRERTDRSEKVESTRLDSNHQSIRVGRIELTDLAGSRLRYSTVPVIPSKNLGANSGLPLLVPGTYRTVCTN